MNISVVVCTFNGAKYLGEQLGSLRRQSRLPDELVIRDDFSSDETWKLLEGFAANAPFTVKLNQSDSNEGFIRNFERAIEKASGDIVFLCDQDDVWDERKIEEVVKLFESDPRLGLVFTDAEIVDENLRPTGQTLWESIGFGTLEVQRFRSDPFRFLLTRKNVVTGMAAAFSRKGIAAALPFPKSMAIAHDGWLALTAAGIATTAADERLLVKYRQHVSQQIGIKRIAPQFNVTDYEAHLAQLIALQERMVFSSEPTHGENMKLLTGYIAHLKARLNLPASFAGRTGAILAELSTGRYSEYSSGYYSAAKDLFNGGAGALKH